MNGIYEWLGIVIGILAIIYTAAQGNFAKSRAKTEDDKAVDDKIDALKAEFDEKLNKYKILMEHRVTELESRFNIFWKDFEKKMADYLHSPHTPETDILLEKLVAGTLTEMERIDLCAQLNLNINSRVYSPERIPAAIALHTHLCAER